MASLTNFAVVIYDSETRTVTLTTSAGSYTIHVDDHLSHRIRSITLLDFVTPIFSTDQGIAIIGADSTLSLLPHSPVNLTSMQVDPAGGHSFFGLDPESRRLFQVTHLGRSEQSVVEIRGDVDHYSVSQSFYVANSIVYSRSDGSVVFDASSLAGEKFIDDSNLYAFDATAELCVIISLTAANHTSRTVNGVQSVCDGAAVVLQVLDDEMRLLVGDRSMEV